MIIISDLHTHTICSDGKWTPEDLLEEAKRIEIKQISTTDHNTLRAINRAKAKSQEIGINFVTGVEIDAKMKFEEEVFHNHILGYNFDTTSPTEIFFTFLPKSNLICLFKFKISAKYKNLSTTWTLFEKSNPSFSRSFLDIFLLEFKPLISKGLAFRIRSYCSPDRYFS